MFSILMSKIQSVEFKSTKYYLISLFPSSHVFPIIISMLCRQLVFMLFEASRAIMSKVMIHKVKQNNMNNKTFFF